MKKHFYLLLVLTLISFKCFADDYYDDDESISFMSVLGFAIPGIVLYGIGRMLKDVKSVQSLGKGLSVFGSVLLGFAALGILVIILNFIGMLVAAIVGIAVKIAIVLGAIALIGYIIVSIARKLNA